MGANEIAYQGSESEWYRQERVVIRRKAYGIRYYSENTYYSDLGDYQGHFFLIGDNVLLIKSIGVPFKDDITQSSRELLKVLAPFNHRKIYLIWDLSEVRSIPVKSRKEIELVNKKTLNRWIHQFVVLSYVNKTLFRFYQVSKPKLSEKVSLANSSIDALQTILANTHVETRNEIKPVGLTDRSQLEMLSKEELIDQLLESKTDQDKRINQIIDSISMISWDQSFKPVKMDINEDDPFYALYSAFSLLKQDVYEIIQDLKDLNQNLELKVAERIIDIIDKESNLRAILDNTDSVTWLINNHYELIDFNSSFLFEFKKLFNVRPSLKDNILELIASREDREKWKIRFDKALMGSPGLYVDQDGERILEVKTFPIREIGKIKGVSIFLKDITNIKKAELNLIEKNKDLEKVNNELDSFVYRVSHDLRAPLTSILGIINLLKIEKDPEKFRELVDLQEISVKKLDSFIQDIINLSRNSRQSLQIERVDFNELVNYILEGQHFYKNSDKIEKTVKIDAIEEFYTDVKRLGVILNNLISNAIKYSNPHIDNPTIDIFVKANKNEAVISITDNGVGIAEEHIGKIFTMFFRATMDSSGSGLGLYIVKESIDKLYGQIKVNSQMRKGSTFTVTIPNLKESAGEV